MRLQILLLAILFAIFCACHCADDESSTVGWNYDKNYEVDGQNPDDDDDDSSDDDEKPNDDDDDYYSPEDPKIRSRKSPDEYGNINIYFRNSGKGYKGKKAKKLRLPVNRFNLRNSPIFPPLLSLLPWTPILTDRLTKQTIIYSPTGGVYIIPPVINFYGQRFSIAELIASGYASLVSSLAPPPPAVDVAPLVHPGPVTGPGIPPPNPATGGFKGAVKTEMKTFARPRYPNAVKEKELIVDGQPGSGYGY